MSILVTSLNSRMERSVRPTVKGKCFICLLEVNISELSQHEKECLDKLQEVDTSKSATSTGSDSDRDSDLSSTSAGSGNTQKRMTRCYICGKDFSQRFLSIHEKQCKRRWELGIIGHNDKTEKETRSSSIHNLHKAVDNDRHKPFIPTALRKAKSYSNVHLESKKNNNLANSHTDLSDKRKISAPNTKYQAKSSSHGNLLKASERRLSGDFQKSPNKSAGRPQTATPRTLKASDRTVTSPSLQKEKSRSHSNLYSKNNNLASPSPSSTEKLRRPASAMTTLSCHDLRNVGKTSDSDASIPTPLRKMSGRVVLCSICKRGFSMYSVYIHEKNCQKKQEREQEQERLKEKEAAAQRHRAKAQEGIKVKLVCGKSTPRKNSSESHVSNGSLDENQKSPRAETPVQAFQRCYICGNLYGSRSLAIHEPQCMRRWEAENNKLPKSKRKERPDRATSPWGSPASPKMVEKNDTPSRSETPNGDKNRTTSPSPGTKDTEKRYPRMKECKYCRKTYSFASLPLHEPKCKEKAETERKPVDD